MLCKNDEYKEFYRFFIMGIASFVDTAFGGADGIFRTLIAFMVLDYISGLCHAISTKSVSSKVGAKGIGKKIGALIIIIITVLIENNILHTTSLRYAIILFYISNEGISIIENIAKMGIPVPKRIIELLNDLPDNGKDQEI